MKKQDTKIASLFPKTVLKTSNLAIGYGNTVIQKDIDLQALAGEQIALIGANGIGKSTLLRTLCGLQEKLQGSIQILGKETNEYSIKQKAELISFVAGAHVTERYMTTEELVRLGRFPHERFGKRSDAETKFAREKAIENTGIEHLRNKKISQISDGEKQKAFIARALAQDTPIMILDEPLSFLDAENSYAVLDILKNLAVRQGKTIIYSTHNISSALHQADKVWLFKTDKILQAGPEDLITGGQFRNLFKLPDMYFDAETGSFRQKIRPLMNVYFENRSRNKNLAIALKKTTERLHLKLTETSEPEDPKILLKENDEMLFSVGPKRVKVQNFYNLAALLKAEYLKHKNVHKRYPGEQGKTETEK